jgi:hypothetical protein
MMFAPRGKALVAQVATPLVSGAAEQPLIVVPPDLKATVPVGATIPCAPVTVDENMTEVPSVLGSVGVFNVTAAVA